MQRTPPYESAFFSSMDGFLRFTGFVLLVMIFFLPQAYLGKFRRKKLFKASRLLYRGIVWILGLTLRVRGVPTKEKPTLYVANHTSYLDIIVLGALIEGTFIAKSDVASWPVIGALAKVQQTAFVERRMIRAAEQRDLLREKLLRGDNLIFFPEGTSTDGQRALPFKSSLFSLAEPSAPAGETITVQPITVVCVGLKGLPLNKSLRPLYAWFGDMTLFPHLWNVFKHGRFTLEIIFHPPATIHDFPDRKALAAHCHELVAKGVEQCITGRPPQRPNDK